MLRRINSLIFNLLGECFNTSLFYLCAVVFDHSAGFDF